ncbi:MAG: glycosyltransferase family 4 protein [Anaerolineae bacterium]|nr:glycosyltransferase family 4 protein [Anaerolineae bacterium]
MKPLHICFISREYPPETGWGGIGSYTYEMAHALAQAGQRVSVITLATGDQYVQQDGQVAVHRVAPYPDLGKKRVLWRLSRVWPGFSLAALRRLRLIHGKFPVDIVEASEIYGDSLLISVFQKIWFNTIKIVVRLHVARIFIDQINSNPVTLVKRVVYRLERQAILKADGITAPSRAMLAKTNEWAPLSGKLALVVPNPIDTEQFAPGDGMRNGEILFVGRLERNKGVGMLSKVIGQVLQAVPGSSFRFVGGIGKDERGTLWSDVLLAEIAPKDHGRVIFEKVARKELAGRYQQSAVCIMPSIWENCPYVLLEAMACGAAVVASDVGGIPEMVENEVTGMLVPAEDTAKWVEALKYGLTQEGLRQRMGAAARRHIQAKYDAKLVGGEMLKVYLQLHESKITDSSSLARRKGIVTQGDGQD